MQIKIVTYFFCLALLACNNNKYPYKNNVGIAPSTLAEMDTAHYTTIAWKDTLINFGIIKSGDSVKLKYNFTNEGETPLFIFNTQTSCGCTFSDFPKDPIMPGKSGVISALYKSGTQLGEVNKTITVIANTKKNKRSSLIIRGIVVPR